MGRRLQAWLSGLTGAWLKSTLVVNHASRSEIMKRSLSLAFVAYLIQFPIVIGNIQGWFPIHPVIVLPPLLGLINVKLENRGLEGLGLILSRPSRSLLLALTLALPMCASIAHVSALEHISFSLLKLDLSLLLQLLREFTVAVFIIAMWEEIASRGYIQNRLQEAWGFIGVIVAAVMFASLHVPSAILEFNYDLEMVVLNSLQMFIPGFVLSLIYWKTRSALTTTAVHGLRNFVFSIALLFSGLDAREMHLARPGIQILWRTMELLLALLMLRVLFSGGDTSKGNIVGRGEAA